MKGRPILLPAGLIFLFLLSLNLLAQETTPAFGPETLPFEFLENKGQMQDMNGNPVPYVLFKAEARGVDFYVTERGLTYVFSRFHKSKNEDGSIKDLKVEYERIDLELQGARIRKDFLTKEFASAAHYDFLGRTMEQSIKGLRKYKKLSIREIYPGIDWVIYSQANEGLKYDFIVHPGADPQQIRLIYKATNPVELNADGSLSQRNRFGEISESAPYTYRSSDFKAIANGFAVEKREQKDGLWKQTLGFSYREKSSEKVIIDPQLYWATFYGGTNFEGTRCIDIDKLGNVYMTGYGASTNFPLFNSGAYMSASPSSCFVLKFDNNGALLWSTYFGSSPTSSGSYLSCDPFNNVFLCGQTTNASNFPLVNNNTYFQNTIIGSADGFVAKFDSTGNLLWSTYFGGTGTEAFLACSNDSLGNLFLVGSSTGTASIPLMNSGTYFDNTQANTQCFITKFSNNGTYLWGTYFKGITSPVCTNDRFGNLYITASSNTLLPTLNPGGGAYFQASISSSPVTIADACVIKFDNMGNQLWTTHFGGNASDFGKSLACDQSGNLFLCGQTTSTNFPLQNSGGYFQSLHANPASNDLFFSKFGPGGNLLWSTYFGGSRVDNPYDFDHLALDRCGNLFFGFTTQSRNLPCQADCSGGYFDNSIDTTFSSTSMDNFIGKFSGNGALTWASYFGGAGNDFRASLVADKDGNLFATGEWVPQNATLTSSYPAVTPSANSYSATFSGYDDLYIAKFNFNQSTSFSYLSPLCSSSSGTFGPVFSGSVSAGGTFSAQSGLNLNPVTGQIIPTLSQPGTYTVSYLNSGCSCPELGLGAAATATIQIGAAPVLSLSGQFTVCTGEQRSYTVSGAQSYTWSNNSNNTVFQVNAPSFTTNLSYYVLGSNNNGCSSTKTFSVFVRNCASLSEINSIEKSIQVYPNPGKGEFTIDCNKSGTFVLLNIAGQELHTFSMQAGSSYQIPFRLSPGMYFIQSSDPGGYSLKLVVEP